MNAMRFETWSEVDADGRTSTTVTDAPIGVQLVSAVAYDKLITENERLRDALTCCLEDLVWASGLSGVDVGDTFNEAITKANSALKEEV